MHAHTQAPAHTSTPYTIYKPVTYTQVSTHASTPYTIYKPVTYTRVSTHTSTPYAIYKPVTYTKNEHRFTLIIPYEKGKRGGSAALEKDIF